MGAASVERPFSCQYLPLPKAWGCVVCMDWVGRKESPAHLLKLQPGKNTWKEAGRLTACY